MRMRYDSSSGNMYYETWPLLMIAFRAFSLQHNSFLWVSRSWKSIIVIQFLVPFSKLQMLADHEIYNWMLIKSLLCYISVWKNAICKKVQHFATSIVHLQQVSFVVIPCCYCCALTVDIKFSDNLLSFVKVRILPFSWTLLELRFWGF
jgi:hypothetical protein